MLHTYQLDSLNRRLHMSACYLQYYGGRQCLTGAGRECETLCLSAFELVTGNAMTCRNGLMLWSA